MQSKIILPCVYIHVGPFSSRLIKSKIYIFTFSFTLALWVKSWEKLTDNQTAETKPVDNKLWWCWGKNPQTFICLVKTPTSFCFNKKQADKVNSIQSIQRLWLIFSRHIRFGKLGVTTIWLNERKKIYIHTSNTNPQKQIQGHLIRFSP